MNDLHRRRLGLRLLQKHLSPIHHTLAWCVEAEIASMSAAFETDYEGKVRQISWNLRQSPTLLQQYTAPTLVRLDDETMARGTPLEEWKTHHDRTMQYQQKLLHDEYKVEDGAGTFKCRRCHSYDVEVEQKQTRSADEGMTVFCECRKCSLRWKM